MISTPIPLNLHDFIDLDALFAMSNTDRDRAIEAMSSETIERRC